MTTITPTMPDLRRYALRGAILAAQIEAFVAWTQRQHSLIDGDLQPHEWMAAYAGLTEMQKLEIRRLRENALKAADFERFDELLERFGEYHNLISGKEDRSYVGLARSWLLSALFATRHGDYLEAIDAAAKCIKELRFVTDGRKRRSSDTFRHLRPEVRDGLRALAADIEVFTVRLTNARAA